MKVVFRCCFCTLITYFCASAVFAIEASEYQYDLMTNGFGIVTNDDLAYDAQDWLISSFNSQGSNSIHWQCVPVENAKATFYTWVLENGRFSRKRERLCASEIQVHEHGQLQRFVIHHAQPMASCHQFVKKWRRLVGGQKMVCLNADFGMLQNKGKKSEYRLWSLEKYKTRLGCDSYFYGVCNTRGCAKGQCEPVVKN
jgi:hypothetical protein